MTIPLTGFCLHIQRMREERREGKGYSRTVGEYCCYWNGALVRGLAGQMVERGGPGDNTSAIGDKLDRRIAAGQYPLAVHAGNKYRTIGYDPSERPGVIPRPGLLLRQTGQRTAILIHPGNGYLSSIGCLNPAQGLVDEDSNIQYGSSRQQVIALIEGLKLRLGGAFPTAARATIPGATVLIEDMP